MCVRPWVQLRAGGGGEEAKLLLTRRVKLATNNLMVIVSHPAEFQVSGQKLENVG